MAKTLSETQDKLVLKNALAKRSFAKEFFIEFFFIVTFLLHLRYLFQLF